MDNPWSALPGQPPFVLQQDEAVVRRFNAEVSERHKLRIDEGIPEPFVGDPHAPIVLLGNNPGFKPNRVCYKLEPRFVERLRANLLHKPSDCPFVFFAPDIHESHKEWWNKKLKELLCIGYEKLSKSLFAVDYFPYPSQRFRQFRRFLPSQAQAYNFQLVGQAIERKALIVVTRGQRRWLRAVPALAKYEGLCEVVNPQTGTISRRNCPRFQEIFRAIETIVV
jgi:hypothetical protein